MIVWSGYLELADRMDLFVPSVAEKVIGKFLHGTYINVQTVDIKFLGKTGHVISLNCT